MPTQIESGLETATQRIQKMERLPHWPEYLMEAAGLGMFMISACVVAVLLEYPGSALRQALPSAALRRVLGGIAMGLTAIAITCSPWGQRSGAHLNPVMTLSFWTLGKIHTRDTLFYMGAQFCGGLVGVLLTGWLIGRPLSDAAVNYAVTIPGDAGAGVAFAAEFLISGLLMGTVLIVSNTKRIARFTPFFAGTLVALYISVEAPLSGMSMNPARTVASALPAGLWTALWVYLTAPLAGMLLAAQMYKHSRGAHNVFCAKLHHCNNQRCIFRCNWSNVR